MFIYKIDINYYIFNKNIMVRYKTSNAALQVTVTSTATSLADLMDTANGDQLYLNTDVNAIEICTEGDIRYSGSGTPTASIGMILETKDTRIIRGVHPSQLLLIASGDTLCNVDIWFAIVN